MRYLESKEKSLECLRLALQMMNKQEAAAHPLSYAVWYEYVSGTNAALRKEIDAIQGTGRVLSDSMINQLYRKHIADIDETILARLQTEFRNLLDQLMKATADSHKRTASYGDKLRAFAGELSGHASAGDAPLQGSVTRLLADTNSVKEAIRLLLHNFHESRKEVERLRRELAHVRDEALTDALSGLMNRKGFDNALTTVAALANAENNELCVVLFDIDDFKAINDKFGHLFGDRVIQAVSEVIKMNSKGGDVAARYGGEEFVLLLPKTPLAGGAALAERICRIVAQAKIRRVNSEQEIGNISVSAGVSQYRSGESTEQFVSRADQAMYAAKAGGKNRVRTEVAD
jgi:diguanylate cyclase